ncbi:gem-associated protein 8-like [Pollicipes pollicipes]|uniref:gem-associated protein 8-like n=1 Tax=Pollicipes pollicipes TaxID=41117 RepID=UPI001884D79F|nr:gem-associated protein 8-like [Pollicipes pollicipes]XP_037090231.1 gem-associated protein 8-like [Pollicipes pollicipes]XP_037090232.1 gem-associated protein 8-like [Pollicipes pollicipes]
MEDFAQRWCQYHFEYLLHNPDTFVSQPHQHSFMPAPYPPTTSVSTVDVCPRLYNYIPPANDSASSLAAKDSSREDSHAETTPREDAGAEEPAPDAAARAGYLRMLLATETHRRERERCRRAEQAPVPLQLGAETERRRRDQMLRLYGVGAERVAALESRVQLEFGRVTEAHRPPLWPNIPLWIRFG